MLHANFMAISSIALELLLIKVLHCQNRQFYIFLRKIVENVDILFAWLIFHCSSLYATRVTCDSQYADAEFLDGARLVWTVLLVCRCMVYRPVQVGVMVRFGLVMVRLRLLELGLRVATG